MRPGKGARRLRDGGRHGSAPAPNAPTVNRLTAMTRPGAPPRGHAGRGVRSGARGAAARHRPAAETPARARPGRTQMCALTCRTGWPSRAPIRAASPTVNQGRSGFRISISKQAKPHGQW